MIKGVRREGKAIDKKTDYWDVPLSDEEKELLDIDLIEELNQKFEFETEETLDNQEGESKKTVIRLLGLITILFLITAFAGFYLKMDELPNLNFLSQSGDLKKNPEIQEIQKAVVMIDAGTSQGTGFNIDASGLIVTNYHVIHDAKKVLVKFPQGKIYVSTQYWVFPEVDLAFIKIKGDNLPQLELAENTIINPDNEVIIIGNPLGFPFVASTGTITGQILLDQWKEPVLTIESYIYKGSSGSPVINSQGDVVGIIFAVLELENDKNKTTGLAIPITSLQERLNLIPNREN